jgi:hypothetical protein
MSSAPLSGESESLSGANPGLCVAALPGGWIGGMVGDGAATEPPPTTNTVWQCGHLPFLPVNDAGAVIDRWQPGQENDTLAPTPTAGDVCGAAAAAGACAAAGT